MLEFIAAREKENEKSVTADAKTETKVQLVEGGEMDKTKQENLATSIFETLNFPVDLNVRSENHISPHILLAISHGLCHNETQSKAEELLQEVVSEIADVKKADALKDF